MERGSAWISTRRAVSTCESTLQPNTQHILIAKINNDNTVINYLQEMPHGISTKTVSDFMLNVFQLSFFFPLFLFRFGVLQSKEEQG